MGIEEIPYDTIIKRLEQSTKQERKDICRALQLESDDSNIAISAEYRAVAGHTFMNIFRGKHDLPYKQILIDVVDKIHPKRGWTRFRLTDHYSEVYIEDKIWEYLSIKFKEATSKLSHEEKKKKEKELIEELKKKGYTQAQAAAFASAFASGSVGVGLASAVTLSIFYSGFFSSIGAALFGVKFALLAAVASGVGAIVAVPLLFASLANPAYRKTIPTTIEFIRIRMRIDFEKSNGIGK
ncbi:MAG: hypothetical protein IPO06_13915 [Leptospiraceae bacterium]|nr:hypothetical protein [Leptospiraceae bacterium]